MDVIGTAIFGDEIAWFRNDGGEPLTWTKQVIVTGIDGPCIGLPVDMDEDGDIDVMATAILGHDVAFLRNDGGDPIEWTWLAIDPFFQGAWPGQVEDMDGDGDIDVVVGAAFGDKLAWWETERANVILNLPEVERSTWLTFTDAEREALATHDFVKLFELGAHNFLTLTLFIAMFERDYDEPLGFQLEYARRLSHFSLPYPDIST